MPVPASEPLLLQIRQYPVVVRKLLRGGDCVPAVEQLRSVDLYAQLFDVFQHILFENRLKRFPLTVLDVNFQVVYVGLEIKKIKREKFNQEFV